MLPPSPTLVSDNKISLCYLIPASSALWTEVEREKRKVEGQIEGEVKRKVKGIERLRLEQVPLSGNGLPRCHDQTRVCTASAVLAEEQPGKLNFGWKWKEEEKKWRRDFTRETRRGESTGVEQRGERETKEDGGGAEASVSSRFTHLTGAKSAKTRGACYRARLNEFGPSVNTRKEKRERENSKGSDGIRGHIFPPPIRRMKYGEFGIKQPHKTRIILNVFFLGRKFSEFILRANLSPSDAERRYRFQPSPSTPPSRFLLFS